MGLYKSKSKTAEQNDEIMTKEKGVTELGVVLCNFVGDFWGTDTWSFSL